MYEIIIKPRAEKEFAKMPKELKEKFYIEFKKLATNPFAHSQIKKIRGTKFGWRLCIERWRVLFVLAYNLPLVTRDRQFKKVKEIIVIEI
jgi:mRNA-degrading endonuclease RelE of RelBE toxin-antitoxin system